MDTKHHESRNLADHIQAETTANIDGEKWDVKQAEVHSDPIHDSGTGGKSLVRRFVFMLPKERDASDEEIFDYHMKNTIPKFLFVDELTIAGEAKFTVKENVIHIVVPCEPRMHNGVRSSIHESAELVQDIISNK